MHRKKGRGESDKKRVAQKEREEGGGGGGLEGAEEKGRGGEGVVMQDFYQRYDLDNHFFSKWKKWPHVLDNFKSPLVRYGIIQVFPTACRHQCCL